MIRLVVIILAITSISASSSSKKSKKKDDDEKRFMKWLSDNDVDVSGFEISKFRGERGLRAKTSFGRREIAIRIPSHLIISEDVARQGLANRTRSMSHSKMFEEKGIDIEEILENIPSCDVLALYIATQRYLSSSPFEPYIKILPEKPNIPLFMDINQIASTARYSESIYRVVEDRFRTFETKIRQYQDIYTDMFDVKPEDFHRDFRWAYGQLLSRAWRVTTQSSSSTITTSPQCFMLPLVDMLNHAENHGEPVGLGNSDVGVMTSEQGIRKGQEMFQNYHITSRCNTESFWLYGFVNLESSEYECAFLDVDMLASSDDEQDKMRKQIALSKLGITSTLESFIVRSSYNSKDILEMKTLWSSLLILETSTDELVRISEITTTKGIVNVANIISTTSSNNVLDKLRRVRRLNDAIESRLSDMTEIELSEGWRHKLHTPSVLVAILLQNEINALKAFDSALRNIWWDLIYYEFVPFALPYFVVMNVALLIVYYRVQISKLLRLTSTSQQQKRSSSSNTSKLSKLLKHRKRKLK